MRRWTMLAVLALVALPGVAAGQDLADFDYENLSFRGVGVEVGRIFPSRVEETSSYTLRMDLGYLGPGVRIVPSVSYWTSPFRRAEVAELEQRVAALVQREAGEPDATVDLGSIEWRDVALGVDAQAVWRIPWGFLGFAGAGVAAHVLDGAGPAIDGTFIDDLLDSVAAGVNAHAGLEYPVTDRFRLTGQGRYEVQGDLRYGEVRVGLTVLTGALVPGEERVR